MADKVRYEMETMMGDLLLLVKAEYFSKEEVQVIMKDRETQEYSFRSTK